MKIGIIGLGLMGGSFARLLLKNGHTVYAIDEKESVMKKAELMKAFTERLSVENASELDMLVAAVFPRSFKDAVTIYLPRLKAGAVVTDFCGTKKTVVAAMKDLKKDYPSLVFVGGHPMAGREFSGIEHSSVNLFEKASMILVPVNADVYALDALKKFYIGLGFGGVVFTTADNHDKMIAFTSQLCHIVSNAFVKNERASEHFGYSAGSYKDMTRVARLNPYMWSDLMTENKDELYFELDELINNLSKYRDALRSGDKDKLFMLLKEGNDRKLAIDFEKNK